MKKLILFFILLLFTAQAYAEDVQIATSTYCPLVCQSADGGNEGIMHDVLRAAFKGSQYNLVFNNIPYGRAIQGAIDGKYAGVTFAGVANAPDFVFVRNLTMTNSVHFVVLTDNTWNYDGIESLSAIRVGIPTGFRTGNAKLDAYFDLYERDASRIMMASNDNPTEAQRENVERLLAKRLDAMLAGSLAFKHISHELGVSDQIRMDPTPVALFHNHLAFSPNNPKAKIYRDLVEKKVKEMKESGELSRIMERYGLQP